MFHWIHSPLWLLQSLYFLVHNDSQVLVAWGVTYVPFGTEHSSLSLLAPSPVVGNCINHYLLQVEMSQMRVERCVDLWIYEYNNNSLGFNLILYLVA